MEVAMKRLVPVLVLLVLAGCAKKAPDMAAPLPPAAEVKPDSTSAAPPGAPDAKRPETAPAALITAPQLAYVFDYSFALPADQIERTLDRDQQACIDAGPTVCQLLGANLDRASEGVASARLEVQATAPWIARFRSGAEAEAKAAGGRVDGAHVQSEDLSRSIVDTEAAVRAKTALRDRMQQLLAERPGKLSDVMDVEHELTQAQADLDATQSELAVMRTRVATSKLSITYNAAGMGAPNGPWRPLHQAANGFLGNAAGVLAALVSLSSVLLPLVLVIGPLVWLAVWFARRRRPARPRATVAPKA
jgi:hypothetical protein